VMRLAKVKQLGLIFVDSPLPRHELSLLWEQLYVDWLAEPETIEISKLVWVATGVEAELAMASRGIVDSSTYAWATDTHPEASRLINQLQSHYTSIIMKDRFQESIGPKYGHIMWLSLLLRYGFINEDLVKCCNDVTFQKRECFMEERKIRKECW
jgi:hypothetical protein